MARLPEILILITYLTKITCFECPDLESCDCKRESHLADNKVKVYNAVKCEGDFDIIDVNFSSLTNTFIKTFTLRNTSRVLLTPETFINLQVDTVRIENTIIEINKNAFIPLQTTLRHLSLVNVNLNFSNLSFLEGFDSLKTLILDGNGEFPYHFPEDTFHNLNLKSLTFLSLKYCGIAYIPTKLLSEFTSLEILDLSHNHIPRVPDAILSLKNLRKLFLAYNDELEHIHQWAFFGLDKLEELDLSYSDIEIILPTAFAGVEKSLLSLKLSHGNLPDGHFDILRRLRSLRRLDISYNRIIEMHNTSFIGFDHLKSLDISGQVQVHGGFKYNVIFTDSMFRGIEDTLKVLRLKDLGLTTLPLAALSPFKHLEILDVSNNDFSEGIDDGFFESVTSDTIVLKNCGITNIDSDAFASIEGGMNFVFDENNITNISFILGTRPCLFSSLSFKDNPIECNCDVVEVADTARVSDLSGTCTDKLYSGEKLKHLHELPITRTMCDMSIFDKPKIDCSRFNVASHTCLTFSCSLFSMIFLLSSFSVLVET